MAGQQAVLDGRCQWCRPPAPKVTFTQAGSLHYTSAMLSPPHAVQSVQQLRCEAAWPILPVQDAHRGGHPLQKVAVESPMSPAMRPTRQKPFSQARTLDMNRQPGQHGTGSAAGAQAALPGRARRNPEADQAGAGSASLQAPTPADGAGPGSVAVPVAAEQAAPSLQGTGGGAATEEVLRDTGLQPAGSQMAAALSRFRALEQGSRPAPAQQPAWSQSASRDPLSRAAAGKGGRQADPGEAPPAHASSTSEVQQQGSTASEQQPRKLCQKPVVPRLPLADMRQWGGQRAAPGAQAAQAASAVASSDPKLAQRSGRARPEDGGLQRQAQGESWVATYETSKLCTQSNCKGSAHGGCAFEKVQWPPNNGVHLSSALRTCLAQPPVSPDDLFAAGGRPLQEGGMGAKARLRPASAESGTAACDQAAPAAASSTTGRSHRGSAAAISTAAARDPPRHVQTDSDLSESSSNSPVSSTDRSLPEVDSRLRVEPGQAAAGGQGPALLLAADRQQLGATKRALPAVRKSREQVLHEQVIQELQHHHMQHPATPVPGPAAMQGAADGLALDGSPTSMPFLQRAGFLREASHTPASSGVKAAVRRTRWR